MMLYESLNNRPKESVEEQHVEEIRYERVEELQRKPGDYSPIIMIFDLFEHKTSQAKERLINRRC